MSKEKQIIESLLSDTGITINGDNPFDLQVHNEHFYRRVLQQGSLGLGESYMDGWWDCERLDQFFHKIISAGLDRKVRGDWEIMSKVALAYVSGIGQKSKALKIGERHYDIGNDLYSAMLDKRLTYTCGYWKDAKNLDEAQEAKLDLVCKKIGLKPGQTVLDIGSGWGSFIGYAAEKYGAKTVGITVSKEQKALTDARYAGLPMETKLMDYRDIPGTYNHIVSVGMFEHVGSKYYRTFMEAVYRALEDDGLFLLHTIGGNRSVHATDPWIERYIFPGGMLPSIAQIGKSIEGLFVMEDWHNFGPDYDRTLMSWHENFENHWDELKQHYDKRFYRMWRYYLLVCAGSFRARRNQLWQIVLSKKGVKDRYKSIR